MIIGVQNLRNACACHWSSLLPARPRLLADRARLACSVPLLAFPASAVAAHPVMSWMCGHRAAVMDRLRILLPSAYQWECQRHSSAGASWPAPAVGRRSTGAGAHSHRRQPQGKPPPASTPAPHDGQGWHAAANSEGAMAEPAYRGTLQDDPSASTFWKSWQNGILTSPSKSVLNCTN